MMLLNDHISLVIPRSVPIFIKILHIKLRYMENIIMTSFQSEVDFVRTNNQTLNQTCFVIYMLLSDVKNKFHETC